MGGQYVNSNCNKAMLNAPKIIKEPEMRSLRNQNFQGQIAVSTHHQAVADKLKAAGANLVLIPYIDAAKGAAAQIMQLQEAKFKQNSAAPE